MRTVTPQTCTTDSDGPYLFLGLKYIPNFTYIIYEELLTKVMRKQK